MQTNVYFLKLFIVQYICSMWLNFGQCGKINCTGTLKTDCQYDTAHHESVRRPKTFLPHCTLAV